MSMISEMLSYPFVVRALVGGILVSLCCALLGVSLVLKRYSMIGDGDSHRFSRLAALNRNLCFLFRIFHGIVYQVTDDIAEMSAVGYYCQCFRLCFQCYVYGDIRF